MENFKTFIFNDKKIKKEFKYARIQEIAGKWTFMMSPIPHLYHQDVYVELLKKDYGPELDFELVELVELELQTI